MVAPAFGIADLILGVLTYILGQALLADPEPITKVILLIVEISVSWTEIVMGIAHIEYAHWVVTGELIDSWHDIFDWELRP